MVQADRPQVTIQYNTIRRMRIACWVIKVIKTFRICNTYRLPTVTVVARTRLNVTLNYIGCPVKVLRTTEGCDDRLRMGPA